MATISNTAPDTDPARADAPSFEDALGELEGIVAAMEAGKMPLQDALDAYKRGAELLRQCQDSLAVAEQQIRILDANGLRDFDAAQELGQGNPETGSAQEG